MNRIERFFSVAVFISLCLVFLHASVVTAETKDVYYAAPQKNEICCKFTYLDDPQFSEIVFTNPGHCSDDDLNMQEGKKGEIVTCVKVCCQYFDYAGNKVVEWREQSECLQESGSVPLGTSEDLLFCTEDLRMGCCTYTMNGDREFKQDMTAVDCAELTSSRGGSVESSKDPIDPSSVRWTVGACKESSFSLQSAPEFPHLLLLATIAVSVLSVGIFARRRS